MTKRLSVGASLTRYVTSWVLTGGANYCPMHMHPTLEIVYHVRGHGMSEVGDGRRIRYRAGDVVLYPAEAAHDQTTQSKRHDCCIHFDCAVDLKRYLIQPILIRQLTDPYAQRELMDLASPVIVDSELDRACLDHRAHATLLRLLALFRRESEGRSMPAARRYAEQAFDYINREFQHIGNLEEVAAHVGVSQVYLRHVFRRRYRMSLRDHVIQVRIAHARNLLMYSELTAQVIAEQCGFATARHFSTAFKQRVGTPPILFRRSQRGK